MGFLAATAGITEVSLLTKLFTTHFRAGGFTVSSVSTISSSESASTYTNRTSIGHGVGCVSAAILVHKYFMRRMFIAVRAVPLHLLGFLHIVEKNRLHL